MRNLSLKLIFIIIVFGTVMAGSVSIAKLYSIKQESRTSTETVEQHQTTEEPSNVVPPTAALSRQHIDEQIQYGDETLASISSDDEYVANAVKGAEFYKQRLQLPLPYELPDTEATSDMLAKGILYRPAAQSGDLTRFQKEEMIRVKKERLENYHMLLAEVQRRASGEERDRESEDYLNRLAEELPFYVPPIVVGNACGGDDTLGCFYNTGEIEITPLALSVNGGKDECLLLGTIAHETQHYNQFLELGVSDYILSDLEDDANKFMRDNTPERCKAPVYN